MPGTDLEPPTVSKGLKNHSYQNVAGGFIHWFAKDPVTGKVQLTRWNPDGSGRVFLTTTPEGESPASTPVVVGTSAVWVSAGNSIRRAPVAGGQATTVYSGGTLVSLQASKSGDLIFFDYAGTTVKIPAGTLTPATIYSPAGSIAALLQTKGTDLLGIQGAAGPLALGTTSGGNVTTIQAGVMATGGFVTDADDTSFFLGNLTLTGTPNGKVTRCGTSVGSCTVIQTLGGHPELEFITAILVDGGFVNLLTDAGLYRLPVAGGEVEEIVKMKSYPNDGTGQGYLWADAKFFYTFDVTGNLVRIVRP